MTIKALIVVACLLMSSVAWAAPTLTVNGTSSPITVSGGASVTLLVQNGPATVSDCVTLTSTADYTSQGFAWVTSASASLPFSMPTAPGTYVFRFWQNCYTQLAVSPTVIVQSAGAVSLTVNGSSAGIALTGGTTVTLLVQNGPGTVSDCVTLTSIADYTTQGFAWVTSTSASLPFSMPTTPGTYVFRFWQNCSKQLAVSPAVTVRSAAVPNLTVNGSSAGIALPGGATVTLLVQNGPGTVSDCVTLTSTVDYTSQGFAWVTSTSASLPFSLPTTSGTYVFRYWQNCYTQLAVSPAVTVRSAAAPNLTVNGSSAGIALAGGATVTLLVQNGPGTASDCVTLTTTADYTSQGFAWVTSTSASLPFSLPTTPGTYVFRFWQNCYSPLATSPVVTVAGSASPSFPGSSIPPELPRVYIDTTMPTTTVTKTVCTTGCNYTNDQLQRAIDEAQLGTTILLEPGATYTPAEGYGFLLKNKTSGNGWIILTTNTPLPAEGVRTTPSDATGMAKLEKKYTYALSCETGAHHYRIIGVEFRNPGNADTGYTGGAFVACDTAANTLAMQDHHIIFDRVYIHGPSSARSYGVKFGVVFGGQHEGVINSTIEDITYGSDSQAIASWSGAGPFTIKNNALASAGENIMFGGADTYISGLTPSDIEVRHNYIYKPLKWQNDPSYTVATKNLFETKNAQRVLIDGNIFENSWPSAQVGYAFMMSPRQASGPCSTCANTQPWTVVQDVTITNNIIKNVANAFAIGGKDFAPPTTLGGRYLVTNNLILGLGAYGGRGFALSALNGVFDLRFQHNTFAAPNDTAAWAWPVFFSYGDANADYLQLLRLTVQDNIFPARGYVLYAMGGCSAASLAIAAPGYTWTNNAFAGPWPTYAGQIASCLPQGNGNTFPANEASLGYVSLSGSDYRLAPSSPLKNAGSDGKDVGADIDAVNAATACATSGVCGTQ